MQRTLLCAPPGTGLRKATRSLERHIADDYSVHVVDVEDHLPDGIRQLVQLPRGRAISGWRKALQQCLGELETQKADIQILSCHLTLYNAVRSEFYSAVSPTMFRGHPFHRVVILLDDIFDMYRRLSRDDRDPRKAGIYSQSIGESTYLDFAEKALGPPLRNLTPAEECYLRTEYRIWALTQSLAWRRAEIVQAELLASQMGVRPVTFLPYGVKHPMAGLALACCVPPHDSITAYVSHSISRFRRQTRAGSRWPKVVHACNRLPQSLIEMKCIPVMPTAIDEYRIQEPLPRAALDSAKPMLSKRWPRQSAKLVRYEASSFSDESLSLLVLDDYESLDDAQRAAIAGLVRGLDAAIMNEVPFRDHLIVAHAKNLLVYRPLFLTGHFSRGVASEISHWWRTLTDWRDESDDRALDELRIAFVHTLEDVRAALNTIESLPRSYGTLQQAFLDHVIPMAKTQYGCDLDENDAIRLLYEGRVEDDLLHRRLLPINNQRPLREQALTEATNRVVLSALTSLGFGRREIGIFVAANDEDVARLAVPRAVTFFLDDGPTDDISTIMEMAFRGGSLALGERLVQHLCHHSQS